MAADVPLSVRFIHGLRDLIHRRWRAFTTVVAVVAVVGFFANGVYTVENGETAALLRFGKLVDAAVEPGLRIRLPGMHEVVKTRTSEVLRVEIEGDFVPELALVTGDENLIEATLVVQYRIKDLRDYLFASESPRSLLQQAVRAALVESLAAAPVDEVLTSAKAAIQNAVRARAQERLDRYASGVVLVAVSLQTVDPPPEASGAFRAVSDARAEAAQAVNRAQGDRDRNLRLARGQAEKLVTESRSGAERRRQQARGAAERFEALLQQKRLAPGQTRAELYNATVQKVLPAARLVILAPGETPTIDVHFLEKAGETEGKRAGVPPGVSFDDR